MGKKITCEEFVIRAREVHGDKYDYSKVGYKNSKTKVCIICTVHGEFWQTPDAHLHGKGCKLCKAEKIGNIHRYSTETFIEKATEVCGDRYDYSKVEYVNSSTKVCIICPEHGEFWQTPNKHLSGQGCPKCGYATISSKLSFNKEDFIEKAIQIHGNKYDYCKVKYTNANTKVCIICPEHGEFYQTSSMHLQGQGCPYCSGRKKLTNEEFIINSNNVHRWRYDYSKVNYVNNKTPVCIICPEHGEFWQKPNDHLDGHGCQYCGGVNRYTTEQFIEKCKCIHCCKYDYSKVKYINTNTKVCIICPEHGEFWQRASYHLSGNGCPKCGICVSMPEKEIMELLKDLNPQLQNREILNGKEVDVYIPLLKIGIEYNGLRWHSEEFGKNRNYHFDKLNKCNKRGVKLIQIFEDEWINHREICESKLKQICGLNHNLPKVFARKCEIKEIKNKDAKKFLGKNHIQGYVASTVYIGAFYDENLVAVMTFKEEKEDHWDLNRFATDINYQCIGVGGKLFKHFTEHYEYQEIKSFADRRWTTNPTNNLYTKLGFEFVEFTKPDYRYYNGSNCERHHKFNFRKQILHKKYGLPLTMTESEMIKELGYTRIWDCGLIKYRYINKYLNEQSKGK